MPRKSKKKVVARKAVAGGRKMREIMGRFDDIERRIVALENLHAKKQMEPGGVAGPVGDPTP